MLNPATFYADLATTRAACPFPFAGFSFDQLAWAIAHSIVTWGVGQPQNVFIQGVASGSAGVGTIVATVSKLILPPNPGLVISGLASAGLTGPLGVALGTVVGQAIPKTITTSGQYTGTVAGVGVGADVSRVVVANPATLIGVLLQHLASFLGPGPALSQMATGLATGISNLLLTCTGTGSVLGTPSPSTGSGPSQSVMV